MQRKDVTPNSDKKSLLQKFGIGLAGGLLGGALILGGAYSGIIPTPNGGNNAATTTSTNHGDTKVSNVSYNVSSDVTKAVKKVQNSVFLSLICKVLATILRQMILLRDCSVGMKVLKTLPATMVTI